MCVGNDFYLNVGGLCGAVCSAAAIPSRVDDELLEEVHATCPCISTCSERVSKVLLALGGGALGIAGTMMAVVGGRLAGYTVQQAQFEQGRSLKGCLQLLLSTAVTITGMKCIRVAAGMICMAHKSDGEEVEAPKNETPVVQPGRQKVKIWKRRVR